MLRERRSRLLAGALVVALAVLGWRLFGSSPDATPANRPAQAARRGSASEAPLPQAEGVRLAMLEQTREEPGPPGRNPFQFGRRSAGTASAPTDAETPAPMTFAPPEPARPTGPAAPPPIPLKFIGRVQKADGTTLAVLVPSQAGPSSPMHGSEGDIIDGRYRIVSIGIESVELAYLDGSGRQTIRLTGQ